MPRYEPSFTPKQLSIAELRHFNEHGFLILRGIFDRELAQSIVALVWQEMPESEDAPHTWTQPIRVVEKVLQDLPIDKILTERYRACLDDLCGQSRWETNLGVGYWINIFPQAPMSHLPPRPLDFHIDTRVSADPAAAVLGLVAIEFFSDIDPGGGGTGIRVGSHRYVARIAAETDFKVVDDDVGLRAASQAEQLPVVEITARAGDVLLMHPYTLHGSSPNVTSRVRLAANRPVSLFEPPNFHRKDPTQYSPVEWAVVEACAEIDS